MPRIAVLFEYPTLLGGERSLLASAERLKGSFEFVAVAPTSGRLAEALRDAELKAVPSPLFDEEGTRIPRAEAEASLIELLRTVGANLLHGNSLAMGRLTGAIASQVEIPCTAHLRDIVGLSRKAITDLNGNTRLIAVSEATRAFHVDQGINPSKMIVLHNGVDLERFIPKTRCASVRRSLGVSDDALVTLTVGQIGLRKGWDLLAEAAALIAERFPNLHMLFAGERSSQKPEAVRYEADVRQRFEEVMPRRFHFLGHRNDMPDLMAASDVLVHPARQEPFGRILLEASAAGLPIVATNVGGTTELLQDGVSARLVPTNDANRLAGAIAELLDDEILRRRLAHAARRRVEEQFSAEAAASKLAAAWHDILAL